MIICLNGKDYKMNGGSKYGLLCDTLGGKRTNAVPNFTIELSIF